MLTLYPHNAFEVREDADTQNDGPGCGVGITIKGDSRALLVEKV
jgi:hypothetical protein